ncbi:hypothetical protein [Bradyrhizobium sp. Gha]|uniref:hypothetical protein n=1 Tax=Bradyrhizobium sp. Gha TaxID=1855318 RepID=UPI001FCDBD09|nr:hypothetical protein [Bradyrhizobium sp. Gha]
MTDHGFEPGDLEADRGLRSSQLIRRTREALQLDDGKQRPQRVDIKGRRHGGLRTMRRTGSSERAVRMRFINQSIAEINFARVGPARYQSGSASRIRRRGGNTCNAATF